MNRHNTEESDNDAEPRGGSGVLYVVGTPIGNLQDLSPRAKAVLAGADIVAAEDTRRTRILLSSIGVETPLIAYHEHNEHERANELRDHLVRGKRIALVSDAGMPLVSDPGFRIVRAAIEARVPVQVVPGPSAVLAALCASGLATDRFVFEGFLPRRGHALKVQLEALAGESRTMVFFEAVHRIGATLEALAAQFGKERPAALARELTKVHEQVFTGNLGEIVDAIGTKIPELGEFVVVVAGAEAATGKDQAEVLRIYRLLSEAIPAGDAVSLTAKIAGLPRNEVYRITRIR